MVKVIANPNQTTSAGRDCIGSNNPKPVEGLASDAAALEVNQCLEDSFLGCAFCVCCLHNQAPFTG